MDEEVLYIEGRRNGYSPNQCGPTMTVGEIVDFLDEEFDPDTKVYISNDRGYTFGNIDMSSFELGQIGEDEE